ncbi:MAG TPA: c-type cytochrome [Roseiarcus sp.]|jgi:mono/diheme cytochrome c family protein|nr:c-type cytochrome [Roseiarcus sp.]
MSARSIAGSALFLVATLPSVLGQQSADPVAGERLAAANCTKCHGAHGAAPAFAKIAAMPSTTQTSLGVFLQTSHASMPNLILSAADRNNLIAYILSLRP